MKFYLGTHRPSWLSTVTVPLFVSRRTLAPRKALPRAVETWALDSGGFSELSLYGRWTLLARDYANEVRRFRDEIGKLDWAAPQDWMCEPVMLQKTGFTIAKHQQLTTANYLELRSIAPDLPWVPVLQGWHFSDYWRHADEYERAGVSLAALPTVGVGTVCRRQATAAAEQIMRTLASEGLRLHGFGFKSLGLRAAGDALTSADSLAWSFHARKRPPLEGHRHKNCANCLEYALQWREELLYSLRFQFSSGSPCSADLRAGCG